MKKLLFLSFAMLSLAACEESEDLSNEPQTLVISFESLLDFNGAPALLETAEVVGFYSGGTFDNVFWGKKYATDAKFDFGEGNTADSKIFSGYLFTDPEGFASFSSYYDNGNQWGFGDMDTWYGFAVSQNCLRDAAYEGYPQFSAWTAGGANGTKTFAVVYRYVPFEGDTTVMPASATPTIKFAKPCSVSFWVANSPLVYTYTSGAAKLTLNVIGYLNGIEVGTETVTLLDESAGIRIDDWTKVDCQFGSQVDKLVFNAEGNSDFMPTYFCLDEITVVY